MATTTDTPMTELPIHECWALVREAVVGRLATVLDGRPEIFPVNHVVDHGSVVIRTAAGAKLESAVGRPVAFEVDGYDVEHRSAWSVVVKGRAVELTRLHEVLDAMGLPLFPWHGSSKPHFLRIEASEVTGRRFVVSGGTEQSGATGQAPSS
jgi:nitroimidazol reductase NimA-like FMN-containing flavoprotein (pyridoxamine 5'-phosphate oxidase superfamily)